MTETRTGRAACLLLALVWFVSMGVADVHAYSHIPLLAGLVVVVLLALSAMIRGAKTVQLSKTAWLSLGVGAFFLLRCLCSFSVVESWREASTILGCGVFYVAGVYAAQGRSPRPLMWTLFGALALNVLAFVLMRYTELPMEWGGRPEIGLGGNNHRPVTLFVYKNFAGAFLIVSGILITALALWFRQSTAACIMYGALGVCSVLLSAECGTRCIFLLAVILFSVGGLMWFILKIHEQESLRGSDIIIGFIFLSGCGILAGWIFMDPDGLSFFSSMNSDGRFAIWSLVCRALPEAPPWGHGACSVQWITLPYDTQSFRSVNYAHNEYLQAWCDYGIIGLFSMTVLLLWHGCRTFFILASESVSATRRRLTASAFLCCFAWSGVACVDFFWHHFALATMTAFALGIMASPYPAEERRKARRRKVLPQGPAGKSVLSLCCVLFVALSCWLVHQQWPVWTAQWEYNRIASSDKDGTARRQLLSSIIPRYPASELMNTYLLLPGRKTTDANQETELLRTVLQANPRQLHIAMQLGTRLSESGMFEEAETLFRTYYPGDGPSNTRLADWATIYAKHLLRWGQHSIYTGEQARGYSLLSYAMNIVDKTQSDKNRRSRFGSQTWAPFGNAGDAEWEKFLTSRRQDIRIMRMLHMEQERSWQRPDASGKPALYQRHGAAESLEKADSAVPVPPAVKKE